MKPYTVQYRQNLLDIALQELGDVSAFVQLASDNNLAITADLEVGQTILIDETKILKPEIVAYYKERNLLITTDIPRPNKQQNISFPPIPTLQIGDVYTLNAVASSGLPVAYNSTNPSVAIVINNTLTIVGAGTATIIATQTGNNIWYAVSASRELLVQDFSIGNGLRLDGINDNISIPNLTLDFSQPFSLNFFILFRNPNSIIIFFEPQLTFSSFAVTLALVAGGRLEFYKLNGTAMSSGEDRVRANASIIANNLYMITTVSKGLGASNLEIYLDGVLQSTTTITNFSPTGILSKSYFLGGRPNSSFYLRGDIYDFKIFNKALTQQEISFLYNVKASIVPLSALSSLAHNYTFNQKSGTVLIDEKTGNNGVLQGFANTIPSPSNAWLDKFGNPILV